MSLEALDRNGHNLHLVHCDVEGRHQIPVIRPVTLRERLEWVGFNSANSDTDRSSHGIHFFIDDYLFERVWNIPVRYGRLMQCYPAVLSPDFSLFTDYPVAVQIYNHWRKHLLAAYWQSLGVTVIPSICWSDYESFAWCFGGEPRGGTVAVSSVGTQKNRSARQLFLDGYREMMLRLKPAKILFFGDIPAECEGDIEHYDPYYKAVHSRRHSCEQPEKKV